MEDEESDLGATVEYRMSGARDVATLKKGGAIVENGLNLLVTEGRLSSVAYNEPDNPNRREYLEYTFMFESADPPAPESMLSEWGAIVVRGKHEKGAVVQIQGKGWIGYDEHGRVQGNFLKPPRIDVVPAEDRVAQLKRTVVEQHRSGPKLRPDANR